MFVQDYKAEATSMRRILFLSKVSPPRVLAAITLRKNFDDLEFQAFGNCFKHNQASVAIKFPKADPLTADKWIKISMIYGAKNGFGRQGIRIMLGAQDAFEFMSSVSWCETDDEFIQAIQVPGGIMMSPIEITLSPLPLKVLQARFYQEMEKMHVRTGPRSVDKKRKLGRIQYARSEYTYPVALIAPPVVFQKRKVETPNCSTIAGTDYNYFLWNLTTNGEKCEFPYDCGETTNMLECKKDESPSKFFGAKRIAEGPRSQAGWFFEFLQTIGAAKVLKRVDQRRRIHSVGGRRTAGGQSIWDISKAPFVHSPVLDDQSFDRLGSRRISSVAKSAAGASSGAGSTGRGNGNGNGIVTEGQEEALVFDPGMYLDFQTEKVEIIMACFSSQYGIVSMIKIQADVESEVAIDFSVKHYQSVEGQRLKNFYACSFANIAVAFVILVNKCVVIYYQKSKHMERHQAQHRHKWSAGAFVVDFVLQVALPLVYVGFRMKALSESWDHLHQTVGSQGMAGITLLSEKSDTHNFDLGDTFSSTLPRLISKSAMNIEHSSHTLFLRQVFHGKTPTLIWETNLNHSWMV